MPDKAPRFLADDGQPGRNSAQVAPRSILPNSRRWTGPRSQRAPQFLRIENRRLAGEPRAHHCKRSSVKRSPPAQRRKIRDRPRQSRWQILRDSLVGVQTQNRHTQPQQPHRSPIQLRGHLILPDYHHLRVRLAEVHHRQPVSSRKNAVLSRDTGIDLKRLLRLVSIAIVIQRIVDVTMQTQQRNRRRRISRWSRRILKRFPTCPQNAKCGFFVRGSARRSARSPTPRIKESAIHRVEELRHHRVANRPRKSEVAQYRRRLVSVKTSNHRESIVI